MIKSALTAKQPVLRLVAVFSVLGSLAATAHAQQDNAAIRAATDRLRMEMQQQESRQRRLQFQDQQQIYRELDRQNSATPRQRLDVPVMRGGCQAGVQGGATIGCR